MSAAVAIAIVVLVVLLALLVLRGSADQTRALRDVHERLGALGEATKRLETMGTAVTEVQQLLQVPKLRGTLGEVWLEELLRQILPGSHYQMQHVFRSGERVDAALRVGDRLVPVDAKFPLEACQRLLGATGAEAEREARAARMPRSASRTASGRRDVSRSGSSASRAWKMQRKRAIRGSDGVAWQGKWAGKGEGEGVDHRSRARLSFSNDAKSHAYPDVRSSHLLSRSANCGA